MYYTSRYIPARFKHLSSNHLVRQSIVPKILLNSAFYIASFQFDIQNYDHRLHLNKFGSQIINRLIDRSATYELIFHTITQPIY